MICVPCGLAMKCAKTGALAELMTKDGGYQIAAADVMECPECGAKVANVNSTPITEHYRPDFWFWERQMGVDPHSFRYFNSVKERDSSKVSV